MSTRRRRPFRFNYRDWRAVLARQREPSAGLVRRVGRAVGWLLCVIFFLLLLAGAFLWWADTSVRAEPVLASPSVREGSGLVVLRADERLFTLMAALNASGYDDENNARGMHPARLTVRRALTAKSLPSLARLRMQLGQLHPSKYVEWVLGRSDPPALARLEPQWWVADAPAALFWGLDGALRDFSVEADIPALWAEARPAYETEIARYQDQLEAQVGRVLAYLRMSPPEREQIIVLPNLLDAYWRGYGPQVGRQAYVVMGPAETLNWSLIWHEAMHPLLNPWVDANLGAISPAETERLYAAVKPQMPSSYQEWRTILRESVIRAVEGRLLPEADRARYVAQEAREGFLLVPALSDRLQEYEAGESSLPVYMPRLLQALEGLQFGP